MRFYIITRFNGKDNPLLQKVAGKTENFEEKQ